MNTSSSKRILITFARSFLTLDLARQLHSCGHKVYIADSLRYHVTRFSNSVTKSFRVPSPRFNSKEYVSAILDIVKRENIDVVLPIYEESIYLSRNHQLFPETCKLFSPSFDLFNTLHNKWNFHCKMEELGFEVLKAHLIRSPEDLERVNYTTPFALKACYSRASRSLIKVHPNQKLPHLTIPSHNPFIAQEWAEGKRYCTYTICHEGKIFAHTTYPVKYAIAGNSCLSFESIEHPGIEKWTEKFTDAVKYTGQIAFDFIETAEGKLYAIECNPRATSGLLLFKNHDRLDKALFKENSAPIYSQLGSQRQIAIGMLLYGWKKSAITNNSFLKFFKDFCSTKDIIFERKDLKPFIFEPLAFAAILKNSMKHRLSLPTSFTYDHEWNGEHFF